MTSQIRHITVDSADPVRLAKFWSEVTGFAENPDDPNLSGDVEAYLASTDGGPALLFVTVPEGKVVKNRVHLDIAPVDRTRDEEIARLIELGATLVSDHRKPDGTGWGVLTDPEGNEFCVERSDAERA